MLFEELKERISSIMSTKYNIISVLDVPTREDVTFEEKAGLIETSVLYIDIRNSTELLKLHRKTVVAKLLKSFHLICAKVIRSNFGDVRSFNGDSLLAFFQANHDVCDNAVVSAFCMKYCLDKLIKNRFGDEFDYGIGIDCGKILAAKAGFKGDYNNDLIWIGKAVNSAAKMGNAAESPDNIRISNGVYERLSGENKFRKSSVLGIIDINVDIWKMILLLF